MSEHAIKDIKAEPLAKQLRSPTGTVGIQIAEAMNASNAEVNQACITQLRQSELTPGLAGKAEGPALELLEIGPGNAGFLDTIFAVFPGVNYTGLDGSEDMVKLARANQSHRVQTERARFIQGTAQQIPFSDGHFNYALSVNTLYFWPDLKDTLQEILRVLKPHAVLCLGFGDSQFMTQLPFTHYGFHLYAPEEVHLALKAVGFDKIQHQEHRIFSQDSPRTLKKHFHCLSASKCL